MADFFFFFFKREDEILDGDCELEPCAPTSVRSSPRRGNRQGGLGLAGVENMRPHSLQALGWEGTCGVVSSLKKKKVRHPCEYTVR